MSPSPPLVIVLRFRDLVRPEPGYTVTEHNKIVTERGYTWWGWWKKQKEEIPVSVWSELARQARDAQPNGIRALLLDSGQRKLYSTQLFTVQYSTDHSPLTAPEGGVATPAYYNAPGDPTAQASWFKIGKITPEANDDELQKLMFAYAPEDDLILATDKDFKNRRLGGISQLLTFGNVTYWVGTPATADALPSLSRLDARLLDPIAPRDIVRAESSRVLHISDLHVSDGMHAFPPKGDGHRPNLATAVYQALKSRRPLPGLVIVSGDLTWCGSAKEFDAAYECLDGIRSTLGLTKQHFIIVPGNHDIQWTQKQAQESSYDFDGKVELALEGARANYAAFFERWYGVPANEFFSIGRRFFLMGGPTLDVIGLNSVALQQMEGQFAGIGRVTERAFDDSAARMGWDDGIRATTLRMVVVHHHLLPVIAKERPKDAKAGFGMALDAGNQVVRALRHGVDIVLHGHQHQPFAGYLNREEPIGEAIDSQRGLLVVGAGSAGVVDDCLGPIKQRSFHVLHLEASGVELDQYTAHRAPDEFEIEANGLFAQYGKTWRRKVSRETQN